MGLDRPERLAMKLNSSAREIVAAGLQCTSPARRRLLLLRSLLLLFHSQNDGAEDEDGDHHNHNHQHRHHHADVAAVMSLMAM